MLEPWEELEAFQKGQRESLTCVSDLDAIKDSCTREHGKRHVTQCSECWTHFINRLRNRYLDSAVKEWFSGRRAFLQELDDLFTKAREQEIEIDVIEQRIADEKKEWFRDKVRYIGLQSATRSPADTRILHQKLNDREIEAEQLASVVRECLRVEGGISEVFDTFSKQVNEAQSPTARANAYIDALFQPQRDPAVAARSQKYIEMIKAGKSLGEVIGTMIRDRQLTKVDLEQKQKLQKKLEELQRAKAANELGRSKRDQIRQEKAQAAVTSPPYEPGRCSVCKSVVNAQDFLTCPLCQVLAEYYVMDEPTLFCSGPYHRGSYESHMNEAHECASGPNCRTLHDSDSEMDADQPLEVFCRECVEDFSRESIFCSVRCFDDNFQRHRDGVHIPERARRERQVDDEYLLRFDPEDGARYSARNIDEHVISLSNAIANWQQKMGAIIS
ncbi:hypothetical protein GGR50DRAFT_664233 [Xylaria sp. CBS 124048]|nr:hypothetical protein GGR50DRAFT_664233 [Xylaria sp. CBS 124048]